MLILIMVLELVANPARLRFFRSSVSKFGDTKEDSVVDTYPSSFRCFPVVLF